MSCVNMLLLLQRGLGLLLLLNRLCSPVAAATGGSRKENSYTTRDAEDNKQISDNKGRDCESYLATSRQATKNCPPNFRIWMLGRQRPSDKHALSTLRKED
jgi:hypothetical protein